MLPIPDNFEYEYRGCQLIYGRGRVNRLGKHLADHDIDRPLIVCGSNVGANEALMRSVREGIGDHLAGVFDGTSPDKRAEEAFGVIDAVDETGADALVGVGGGSSLDIARQASVFAADGRSLADLRNEALDGEIASPDPDEERLPVVVVPTTFAGADVSGGGSIELFSAASSPTGQPVTVRGPAWPITNVADPALFETTPTSVLAKSAMNGFDKGIETLYDRDANPTSDAMAIHGLRLLHESLPQVAAGRDVAAAMDRAVAGLLLVQIDRKLSIVHAFGHGFARRYDVQQGSVHAVVVPHVLQYLFGRIDARRTLLASGLGIDSGDRSDTELGDAIVEAVAGLRDALGIPTRLRDLPETREADLQTIAEFIIEDRQMKTAPIEPSTDEIEGVLRDAW